MRHRIPRGSSEDSSTGPLSGKFNQKMASFSVTNPTHVLLFVAVLGVLHVLNERKTMHQVKLKTDTRVKAIDTVRWMDKFSASVTVHIELSCENTTIGPCCTPWLARSVDDWWVHHPDWDIVSESDAEFCFGKIQDTKRAAFLRRVYNNQFHGNCSNDIQTHQISSGYGASVGVQMNGYTKAVSEGRPFQITKHWPGAEWLYMPRDNSSWAWCPSTDLNCYILPVSSCPPDYGRNDGVRDLSLKNPERQWLLWHFTKFRQHVRKKLYDTLQTDFPELQTPCTTMHVRRGDTGLPRIPYRRYAALSEYIEVGHVQPGDNVVLLTDDYTTIEEAQRYHAGINWIYVNRPRNNGTAGGFDGHIPSKDQAFDLLMILAELRLASRCSKLIHGDSGFAMQIKEAMAKAGTNYTKYHLRTIVSRDEATELSGQVRGKTMLEEIQTKYENRSAVESNVSSIQP